MKFAYTRLITEDVRSLATFYEITLGVTRRGDDSYVEFHPGGAILAIASRKAASFVHGGKWSASADRSAILEFEVDDVDAERARIDPVVTDWLHEPKDMPWGTRSMLFRDPDGNPINFFKPIAKN